VISSKSKRLPSRHHNSISPWVLFTTIIRVPPDLFRIFTLLQVSKNSAHLNDAALSRTVALQPHFRESVSEPSRSSCRSRCSPTGTWNALRKSQNASIDVRALAYDFVFPRSTIPGTYTPASQHLEVMQDKPRHGEVLCSSLVPSLLSAPDYIPNNVLPVSLLSWLFRALNVRTD
jgi:hypothetical protein